MEDLMVEWRKPMALSVMARNSMAHDLRFLSAHQ
jgi:hypothetical protein